MGGLYFIPTGNRDDRVFPVWRSYDGTLQGPLYISYPFVPQIISSVLAAVLCLTVPFAIVALFQIRLRNLWDFHAAAFGLLKALIAA
jgi:hypothetical protein